MPITIAPIQADPAVILAPMSGVTDAPFRLLARRYGAPLIASEMFASSMMQYGRAERQKRCIDFAAEHPLIVQLVGGDAKMMAEAARIAVDCGAAVIDINMGCPARKIAKSGGGAVMMQDEANAVAVVNAVTKAINVPVTVKMRLGWDENSLNAPSLASKVVDAGACLITVHGRTRMQLYSGQADWRAVKTVVDVVSVPVIVNGDICDTKTAQLAMEQSGAEGVMVGRAACGRPWLVGHIATGLKTGQHPAEPSLEERHGLLQEHADLLISAYGPHNGVVMARKHIAWGLSGLAGAAAFREQIFTAATRQETRALIRQIFDLNIQTEHEFMCVGQSHGFGKV